MKNIEKTITLEFLKDNLTDIIENDERSKGIIEVSEYTDEKLKEIVNAYNNLMNKTVWLNGYSEIMIVVIPKPDGTFLEIIDFEPMLVDNEDSCPIYDLSESLNHYILTGLLLTDTINLIDLEYNDDLARTVLDTVQDLEEFVDIDTLESML